MTQVELVDDDGIPVPDGTQGELYGRSPYNMIGYLDDAESTADALRPDGYLTSGDVAIRDDEGFIRIVDRKKDLIISGAANIYPREIENIIHKCAGVRDVAVIGLPDQKWGEQVTAFVVPRPGAIVDFAQLEREVRKHLAGYKTPRAWRLVDDLPRNANGKILKRVIRDNFLAGEASE